MARRSASGIGLDHVGDRLRGAHWLELVEPSERRRQLEEAFAQLLERELEARVQAFDQPAAWAAGSIAADRRRAGSPVEVRDAQIAGIAMARRATFATRHTRQFAELSVELVNPWAS